MRMMVSRILYIFFYFINYLFISLLPKKILYKLKNDTMIIMNELHKIIHSFFKSNNLISKSYQSNIKHRYSLTNMLRLHRFLFKNQKIKNTKFVNNNSFSRDIIIAFHTDILWENLAETMNHLNKNFIVIVVSDHEESKQMITSFKKSYKASINENGNYTSPLKEWKGKEVKMISIAKGYSFMHDLMHYLNNNIPVIMSFDVFPNFKDVEDTYTFELYGRPILKASNMLFKICKKYEIGIIPFFNKRNYWGEDTVYLGNRIRVLKKDDISVVYDKIYNFMIEKGTKYPECWQGLHIFSRNIVKFWKSDNPHQLKDEIISSNDTNKYINVKCHNRNMSFIINEYPFICIQKKISTRKLS